MIAALARAAAAFDEPDWLDAARAAFAFSSTNLRDDDGRLAHAWREGRRAPRACSTIMPRWRAASRSRGSPLASNSASAARAFEA